MNTICMSLGGSMVSRKNGVNVSYIRRLAKLLKKYTGRYKFIITVGGGYASRLYISSSRQIITNEAVLDEIAIAITRINALIVKDLFSDMDVYPNVVTELGELRMANKANSVVFMGGLLPGISTDAVATLTCEVSGSKVLINISEDAYIYDRPPTDRSAKKLETVSHDRMVEVAALRDTRNAGSNFVFDLVAAKLAKRGNIEVRFVNDDMAQLELAIAGKKHKGTTVK
jgi:uridylate kinase